MKAFPSRFVAIILLSLLPLAAQAADRWTPLPIPSTASQLPQLKGKLVVDGKLDEWGSAACVPIRSKSYISILGKGHVWRGPADAGMEFYCAWTAQGFCAAAVVTDDDVRNAREGGDIWQQDCVELFIDGRSPDKLMKPPYSKGAYQILVRSPLPGKKAIAVINKRDGEISGLQIAGVKTKTGYVIEMFIPWSAFPDITAKPGMEIGLQFAVDDYDAEDGELTQPLMMSYSGIADMWQKPENLTRWALSENLEMGPKTYLGPLAAVDVPLLADTTKPVTMSVELNKLLSAKASTVGVTVTDFNGKQVYKNKVKTAPLPAPWQSSSIANIKWDAVDVIDGYSIVEVTAFDKSGKALGYSKRPMLLAGYTARYAGDVIKKADVPKLSQKDPYKAAQYVGLAACAEKYKRHLGMFKVLDMQRAAKEAEMRMDVLEDGKLDAQNAGLFDLLELTINPDAQVVVEYPEADRAAVEFYWGSIPLAFAYVSQVPAATAAKRAHAWQNGQMAIADGDRLISINCASKEASEKVAWLVAVGKPVTLEHLDAIRKDLVAALNKNIKPASVPSGMKLYCGDVHMHTMYSDGKATAIGLIFQAMHCFMDYSIMTDHDTIEGAVLGQKLFAKYNVKHPFIVGEEITIPDIAHFNAYPLKEAIPSNIPIPDIIKAAHAQNAVIQWNHPHAFKSEWTLAHLNTNIADAGLHAWEHVPNDYQKMKTNGTLPVVVGASDTHDGTFSYGEKTIIFAPSPNGEDVAEAVKHKRVVALSLHDSEMLYGKDDMIQLVVNILSEGKALRHAKEQQLKEALKSADFKGLILAGPSRYTAP